MPRQLIVNADDFGLTRGINNAIIELQAAGALTSGTLMANGAEFEHAAQLARSHPQLAVGCHIVLTDGVPILPPGQIPSLVGEDGRSFRSSLNDFLRAALRGRIRAADIENEAIAQIRRVQQAGIAVTHIDTHKHTHVIPRIAAALVRAAEATGVRAIRNPFEPMWSLRLGYTAPFRLLSVSITRLFRPRFLALPAIRSGRVRTSDGTIGISATGQLDEPLLARIVQSVPSGTWELVCHPGYNDAALDGITTRLRHSREVERDALIAVLSQSRTSSQERSTHLSTPELIHYGRLSASGLQITGTQH